MAFYGINCIGEVIERPFDWREPNHDLAGSKQVWRSARSCTAGARRTTRAPSPRGTTRTTTPGGSSSGSSSARASPKTPKFRRRREPRATRDDARRVDSDSDGTRRAFEPTAFLTVPRPRARVARPRLSTRACLRRASTPRGNLLVPHRFVFGLLQRAARDAAGGGRRRYRLCGERGEALWCGAHVSRSSECALTFHTEAHAICGAIIGFLLVFCANIALRQVLRGENRGRRVYHGLRNVNVCAASFLRPAERGEPGYVEDERERQVQMDQTREDVREINRLVDVLFAFLRMALRERRHGVRVAKNASGGSAKKKRGVAQDAGRRHRVRAGRTARHRGLDRVHRRLSTLLFTDAERAKYLTLDPLNRFNVAVADLHRAVERRRETGALYEKAAHEMYRECDVVLAAYKTCERVVTTPIRTSTCTWSTWCFSASCSARRSCSAPPSTGSAPPLRRPRARLLRHLGGGQDHDGPLRLELTLRRPHRHRQARRGRGWEDRARREGRGGEERTRAGASRGRARRRVRRITRRAFRKRHVYSYKTIARSLALIS